MNIRIEKTQDNKNNAVASDASGKQKNNETASQLVNNRPEAIAQRKLQEMANNSSQVKQLGTYQRMINSQQPIQKMAAVALDDKSKETDFIVASSLNYALETAGGPLADFGTNSNFSVMKPKERLIIVHHGEIGKIGKYNGTQTVEALTQASKAIPKNIGGITLMSCYSGVDGDRVDTSLADQVADQLKDKGYTDIPVKGAMGPAIASSATSARAVKPSKVDNVGIEVQNALLFKYNFVKEHRNGFATKLKTVDEILTEHSIDPSGMSIENKISEIGQITSGFYREFIQMAEKKGYLIDQGADGVEITWSTK